MLSKHSLARSTIIKMGVRIAIITIIVTLVSYWHVMSNLELQIVKQLDKYIIERGQYESTLFLLAEDNHIELKKELLWQLEKLGERDPQAEFDRLFVRSPDGVIRNRPKLFDGRRQAGVYIDETLIIDASIRRRVLIFYELATLYGKAWHNRFQDTYIITPENFVALYLPELPTWAQDATTDLYIPDEEYMWISDKKHNPKRVSAWTGLFYDKVSKTWMVSCTTPVDMGNRHIATIGHDIFLNELLDRTITNHIEGTHNIIFREDGRLIAHPQYMTQIMDAGGNFNILKSNNEHLLNIFQSVKERPANAVVIENSKNNEYLAVTKIDGPDWYFVTVYPKSLLADLAFDTARFILLLGILSLLLEISIMFLILRSQIAKPLYEFISATQQIATGDFNIEASQHLPLNRKDEIGELAHSFNSMAGQLKTSFDTLDAKVIERTHDLAERIKEIKCLYSISNLAEKKGLFIEEILQGTLEIISPSWQYPSITCAKIVVDGQEFKTANFKNTAWHQNSNIVIKGQKIGSVEVCYLKEKPESDEGPFMQEEINLINTIATQLGRIIENKQAEEALAKRTQELSDTLDHLKTTQAQLVESEKMASLGGLVAGVAHEINTPIGICVTAASTLADRTTETATAYHNNQLKGSALKAYFNMAQTSSNLVLNNLNRAADLIQSFKQVAVDQNNLDKRSFAVKKYIQNTLISLKPHLKKTPHQITVHGDEQIKINSYPGAFSQIVTNLVMNSVRHAYPSGEAGNLRFEVKLDSEQLIIEYSDDGCGISPENLDKIFEPFFTTARAQGGTGLGLHIVFNLVTQKLNGTINVQSEIGVGTTFILNFPL